VVWRKGGKPRTRTGADFTTNLVVMRQPVVFQVYPPMLKRLETYFEFTRLGTNWRTEILAVSPRS
jgi:hypothetical protein